MAEETKSPTTTVPGGKYIQGDRFVDAEGKDLGAASKSDTTAVNEVAEPAESDRQTELSRKGK